MTPALRCALAALLAALTLPAQELPTISIDGRVTDVCGEPLPVAEVWLTVPGDEDGEPRHRTFCDGVGQFRLGRVPQRREWHVHARLDGYEYAIRRVRATQHAERVVFELREAVTVRGVLRDAEQRAVAGRIVRALSLAGEELSASVDATTDGKGRFVLRNVAIGPQRLVAFVPGPGFATQLLTVTGDCELELEPTAGGARDAFTVGVTGIAAADLAAVRLRCGITHRMRELSLPPPHDAVPLAADGSLTLAGVYGGALALRIDAPGYVVSPRTRWFADNQAVFDLEFEAAARGSRALALHGTLQSTAGAPLAGVDLVMTAADGSAPTFTTTRDDGTFILDSSLPRGDPCVLRSLDGRFLLEPLFEVQGRHPNVLRCEASVKPQVRLSLRAIESATVQGRVHRPDGRPAAGLRVQIEEQMPEADGGWVEVASAVTDREGVYRSDRIHPKAKALRLVVDDPRGCGTSAPFQLGGQGGRGASRDLELEAPVVIKGTLRSADGTPIVAERVYLARPHPAGAFFIQRIDHASGRYTDRRGRFLLRFPAEPEQTLRVWAKGAKSEPFEAAAGDMHRVELVRDN